MAHSVCAKCSNLFAQDQTSCPACGGKDRIVFDADQAHCTERQVAELELARKHYEVEPGLTHIYRITDESDHTHVDRTQSIKLLEVNTNTVESGVMPLHFGPAQASGIRYSSIIIEVTPSELEKIRSHQLKLPAGWEIGEELPRSARVEGN